MPRANAGQRRRGKEAEEVQGPEQPPKAENQSPEDLYAVLGVPAAADQTEIASAFRSLIKKHHPDVNRGRSSAEAKQIVAAYRTLADPGARTRYDAALMTSRYSLAVVDAGPPPATAWLNRGVPFLIAFAFLATIGLAAAFLLDPPGLAKPADTKKAALVAQQAPSEADEQLAPTEEWLVGAWVREDSPCVADSVTVFHDDATWSAAGGRGRWRIDKNELMLEPQRGAVSTGANALWEIERIAGVAPDEFKTFSGHNKVQRTFDRCRRIG